MSRRLRKIIWAWNPVNPERLWVHFALSLLTGICLLAAIHLVSRNIVTGNATVAKAINASAEQIVCSQKMLRLATELSQQADPDFSELARLAEQFETTHLSMLQGDIWSDQLQEHYFGATPSLNTQVRQFADLANQLTRYPPSERAAMVQRMNIIQHDDGLFDALRLSGALFSQTALAETAHLKELHSAIILVSIVLLIAQALLVFFPAHVAVKNAIVQLRRKTEILSKSQTQLRGMNAQLQHMVTHDQLTGMSNRSHMLARLTELFEQNKAGELGVVLISLDGFKAINDTIGHEKGDTLLTCVAQILIKCVDESDIIARIGGDEFFLSTSEPPEDLAKRVLASLQEPVEVDGRQVTVACSIGFMTIDLSQSDPDQLLTDANIALQSAKTSGGRRAAMFSPALRNELMESQQIQAELRDAIGNGEIEPWFQPQVRLVDGSLRGAEVLARWRHPTRGLLTPDKFFPAAERAGLTTELDYAIWKAALSHASVWQQNGQWRPRISLNAAPETIADTYLIERLLKQIHNANLEPDQVIIEVLESTVIETSDDLAAINIDGLSECGIELELDDFGTGYASLSKLTQLPIAGIKLDRSLIAPLPAAGADSVVRAILALAAELGLFVVAEGIEEHDQANHLNRCGCAIGQGYGFARPMPFADFDKWLGEHANGAISIPEPDGVVPMRA